MPVVKILSLLLFVLALMIACDQRNERSSVAVEASKMQFTKDTIHISALIEKARALVDSLPEESEMIYRQAYIASLDARFNEGVVHSVIGILARQFERGKFDSGEHYCNIAEKHALAPTVNKTLYPTLMMNKGTFFYLKGDKVNADKAYYAGLQKARETGLYNEEITAKLLYNLHFSKVDLNQPAEALQYLHEAEAVVDNVADKTFLKSIRICKANVYLRLDMDSAKQIVAEIFEKHKDQLETNDIIVISSMFSQAGEPERAIGIIQKGIEEAEKIKVHFATAMLRVHLGKMYNQLKRYKEAQVVLKQALDESMRRGFSNSIGSAYQELIDSYVRSGNYKEASLLQSKHFVWRDTMLNNQNVTALNELNVKYKTAEKDKKLAKNQLEKEALQNTLFRQRLLIIAVSIASLLVVLLFILFRRSVAQKARMREHELVLLKQRSEIQALRSKMEGEEAERQRLARELHDGMGALVSSAMMQLRGLENSNPEVLASKNYTAIRSILKTMADDVRSTANNLMPDHLIKLGFSEAVKEYLCALKKPGSLNIDLQVYGPVDSIEKSLQLMLYRVIQELMHNIIRHANASNALVQIALNSEGLALTVEDDGRGMPVEEVENGNGLRNIRSRVEQFKGQISVDSLPGKGTTVQIDFDKKVLFDA